MIVDELAGEIHRAVGEAVGASIQRAIGLQETAVIDLVSAGVLDRKLHPGLVEIANLWNQRVPYVLVLDHHVGFHHVVRRKAEGHGTQGRDQVVVPGFFQREDIHVQKIARLQELDRFLQLFVEAIVERHGGVSRQPAMRREESRFRAVFRQRGLRAMHVAALAGIEVRRVKSQRIALGEFGVLPLIVNGEGADKFVIVQGIRQVGFVAGGTEFRRPIKRLHHRLRVTLGIFHDFVIRNLAGNARAPLVYHYRGNTHHVAAVARSGLQSLDRMTGRTGQTVLVERTIDVRVLRQSAGDHDDRIVATVAMSREFDAFSTHQNVDARSVERRAKRVRVQRLTPLVVGLFVAMATILGLRKSTGLNELIAHGGGVAGEREVVLAETKIEGLPCCIGVVLAFRGIGRLCVDCVLHGLRGQCNANQETGGSHEDSAYARIHHALPG